MDGSQKVVPVFVRSLFVNTIFLMVQIVGKWPDGEELYNLSNDPQEKRNLAALPQVSDRLQEFRGILESVQERATSGRKPSKN